MLAVEPGGRPASARGALGCAAGKSSPTRHSRLLDPLGFRPLLTAIRRRVKAQKQQLVPVLFELSHFFCNSGSFFLLEEVENKSVQFWKRQTCKSKPDFEQHE